MNNKVKLSIVLSTLNELSLDYLERSLSLISSFNNVEIIAVDGGSSDGTLELLERSGCHIIETQFRSRGKRLMIGVEQSQGEIILLNHPRSLLEKEAITSLLEKDIKKNYWGGFVHRFDSNGPLLCFTSWYSNQIRGRIREILYLDHCIFFSRDMIEEGMIPNVEIFEDTYLSLFLKNKAPVNILPFFSTTSSIRFQRNGLYKQAILNQILKLGFILNFSEKVMNKIYEKGLSLNTKV